MDKQRILWIDNVKGIGMLMVIVVHTCLWSNYTSEASMWARTFCMPLFFILSGITKGLFPNRQSIRDVMKIRLLLLMVPFVVFSVFNSLQKFAGMIVLHTMTMEAFWEELSQIPLIGNGVVWFLQALFLAELLFYWLGTKSRWLYYASALLAFLIPFAIDPKGNQMLIVLN